MLEKILWVILAHYVLDYPFQTCPQAKMKGTHFYSLFSHSVIYGLGMALILKLLGVFTVWKAIVLVCSHIIIDYLKATAKDKDKALTLYLYVDQGLHICIDVLMLLL